MQLTLYTDYSLRTLMYLAIHDGKVTISEIADFYGASKNHLVKVINNLSKLNYIETTRGRSGGIKLNIAPEDINLADVIKQVEPNFDLVECFNLEYNRCPITPVCQLAGILSEAQSAFMNSLKQYTLKDLISNKDALLSITGVRTEEQPLIKNPI